MLIDDVNVRISAGHGGKGKVAFNKTLMSLGPAGGSGGHGGSAYAEGVSDLSALGQFRFKKEFAAEDGVGVGEGFFHEDVYLAWRAHLMGYAVVHVPGVVVRHLGGATLGSVSEDNRFYLERNRRLNFLTLFSRQTRWRVWPLMWLARLLETAGDWRAGRTRGPLRRTRAWLREHRREVGKKRAVLQGLRRVPDREIIRLMSYRVTNAPGLLGRLANAAARVWCRLVGLRTWDLSQEK